MNWALGCRESLSWALSCRKSLNWAFSETAVGCTASYFIKIKWCSLWFCNPPPLFWGCVLLYLRSPKGGCCSKSDDLSCSWSCRKSLNWALGCRESLNWEWIWCKSLNKAWSNCKSLYYSFRLKKNISGQKGCRKIILLIMSEKNSDPDQKPKPPPPHQNIKWTVPYSEILVNNKQINTSNRTGQNIISRCFEGNIIHE